MPEELKVDYFECKDLEFARNLARSMKEGYGRHNSNLAFRPGQSSGRGVHMAEFRYATNQLRDTIIPIFHIRENQQARVVGRIGDNVLRERWQDCAIGDAVPEELFEARRIKSTYAQFGWLNAPVFERVCFRMTDDNGRTWQNRYYWKRIE